jgi:Mg2+ and Co2+ transporter CorA
VENTREWNQRPKLDDYRDHVLLVYYGLRSTSELQDANPLEVHIRTNDVTKSLTIVATIFLPLSFVTGFFGQNFGWLVQRIGSFAAFWGLGVGSLLVSCVALFAWFRQRGWL